MFHLLMLLCAHVCKFEIGCTEPEILTTGGEISVFLKPKASKAYFVNITTDNGHVRLFVTPCGGMVKWTLAQQVPLAKKVPTSVVRDLAGSYHILNFMIWKNLPILSECHRKYYQHD